MKFCQSMKCYCATLDTPVLYHDFQISDERGRVHCQCQVAFLTSVVFPLIKKFVTSVPTLTLHQYCQKRLTLTSTGQKWGLLQNRNRPSLLWRVLIVTIDDTNQGNIRACRMSGK